LGYHDEVSGNEFQSDFISRLRDAVDIVELISDHVRLKQRGRSWEGLCPFHEEKTPSFSVDPVKGLYYCFGCHEGGDVFKFVMSLEHLNFPEAVEYLARRFGVPVPQRDPEAQRRRRENEAHKTLLEEALAFFRKSLESADGIRAREELLRRGFEENSWKEFGFGWAPDQWRALLEYLRSRHPDGSIIDAGLAIRPESGKQPYDRFRGRLMFPIRASDGSLIAFGGRILGAGEPKYLNSPEGPLFHKRSTLFMLHRARKSIARLGRVIIVEGYFDCLSLHRVGITESLATLGTALTSDHARTLRRLLGSDGVAFLSYDADSAGKRAARAGSEVLLQAGVEVRILRLPDGSDPDDIIRGKGVDVFRDTLSDSLPLLDFLLAELPDDPARLRKEGLELAGLVCGAHHPATRQNLIDELARRLNLRPRDIENHGRKMQRHISSDPHRVEDAKGGTPVSPGEMELVRLLLDGSPDIRKRALEEIDPETLSDPRVREIFRIACTGVSDLVAAVLDQDDALGRLLAAVTLRRPEESGEDRGERTLELILNRQRRRAARKLQQDIEKAVATGDNESLSELLEKKARLRQTRH